MKYVIGTILFFITCNLIAQNAVQVQFSPLIGESTVRLNKKYITSNDTISILKLKFYITDFVFLKNKKVVSAVAKKHQLLNIEQPGTLKFQHFIESEFDAIEFKIGVDTTTQTSGVHGGDLDPMLGMYWTWQSGYIHFKLEGTSKRCTGRNNRFQLHIGGYQEPYNTISEVYIPIENKNAINIAIQIDELLEQLDLSEIFDVMSPGKQAVAIAQIAKRAFKLKG